MTNDFKELPEAVARREQTMGEFTALFARRLPDTLRIPVAFCSPASFRVPEGDNCWHPYAIQRGFLFFLWDQWAPFIRSFVGGVRRLVTGRFGAWMYLPNHSSGVLAVTPASLCAIVDGKVKTTYCHPNDAEKMAWLVIDEAGKERSGYGIGRGALLGASRSSLFCWMRVSFFSHRFDRDWIAASILTLRWIVGFQWVTLWMYSRRLCSILSEAKPQKVFCVHEMHPWSRVVWEQARRLHISTITFQHAAYRRTKLWFFPTPAECLAGLATPERYVVFSQRERTMLSPFYPVGTQFPMGCGPRFAHWQTYQGGPSQSKRISIVFATSIPWWDNETVLAAAGKLVKTKDQPYRILIRLHPLAVVPRQWKRWLNRMISSGAVSLSRNTLKQDLQAAAAVVGANSTVLEEAALLGRSIFVLGNDRYLPFGTGLGVHVPWQKFSWQFISSHLKDSSGVLHQQQECARLALGVDCPVFRLTEAR